MLRSSSQSRVVYESIPPMSWAILAFFMLMGLSCVVAAPRRVQSAGYKTAGIGLAALFIRRRIVFDRTRRDISIHWALSIAPALPALNLRLVSLAHLDMFTGVCVGSCTFQVYNPKTRSSHTVEEHAVRFVRKGGGLQVSGLAGDGELIHRVGKLGGVGRAAIFAQQVADDLGIRYHAEIP